MALAKNLINKAHGSYTVCTTYLAILFFFPFSYNIQFLFITHNTSSITILSISKIKWMSHNKNQNKAKTNANLYEDALSSSKKSCVAQKTKFRGWQTRDGKNACFIFLALGRW